MKTEENKEIVPSLNAEQEKREAEELLDLFYGNRPVEDRVYSSPIITEAMISFRKRKPVVASTEDQEERDKFAIEFMIHYFPDTPRHEVVKCLEQFKLSRT